jgi:hypothetical protein
MDELELKKKRLRYLQLKAKSAGSASMQKPLENPQSKMEVAGMVAKGVAKAAPELYKPFIQNAPEVLGATLSGMKASGVGTLPAMALTAGGAAAGEGVRQLMSDEELTPMERAKKLGAAGLRGAAGPVVERAVLPAIGAVGKFAGNQLEKLSNLSRNNKGVLTKIFKDPSLLVASGSDEAGNLYQAAKSEIPAGTNVLDDLERNVAIYRRAKSILKQGGKLEPYEAKQARNAVDSMMESKQYSKDALVPSRKQFDQIAKSDPKIAKADVLSARAAEGGAVRNLYPTNRDSTFSKFLPMVEGALLGGGLYTRSPMMLGAAAAFSPLAQGTAAAGLGMAAKPFTTAPVGLTNLIAQYLSKTESQ